MKQHLTLLLVLCSLAAAPATKPTDRFEPYTEEIKTVAPDPLEKFKPKFDMLPIKGGTFVFAINKAAPKKLEIKSFWMAKTECTWDLYQIFWYQLELPREQRKLRAPPVDRPDFLPLEHPDRMFGGLGYPVISTTPHAAQMYCQWLSQKTGRKYRLPTEAEWEYACCAGIGNQKLQEADLDAMAWYLKNSYESFLDQPQTHPVMEKKRNLWGLHDMLGNAGEWCTTDQGAAVLRGGWYSLPAREIHCSTRAPFDPQWNRRGVGINTKWWLSDAPFAGFRVVREE